MIVIPLLLRLRIMPNSLRISSVVSGAGKILEDLDLIKKVATY